MGAADAAPMLSFLIPKMIIRNNERGGGSLHFVAFSSAFGHTLSLHVAIPIAKSRLVFATLMLLKQQRQSRNSLFLLFCYPYSHISLAATDLTLLHHYTSFRSPPPLSFTFVNVKNYIW